MTTSRLSPQDVFEYPWSKSISSYSPALIAHVSLASTADRCILEAGRDDDTEEDAPHKKAMGIQSMILAIYTYI